MLPCPTLTVHLGALTRNYQRLRMALGGIPAAGVVKANAYGLGVLPVAGALAEAGCTHFFVATAEEGVQLREAQLTSSIYILNGLKAGEEKDFQHHTLRPVLNTYAQVALWAKAGGGPSALQLDTGMSRLGLDEAEVKQLATAPDLFRQAGIGLVMSHLACADDTAGTKSPEQRARFDALCALLPPAQRSLANSAAIFLGQEYHYDLARPGCALYGINPNTDAPNPMEHVATLWAPILQLRTLDRDSIVGYDATCTRRKGTRIATVELGYADGLFRHLGNKGVGFVDGQQAPIIGRISMDMLMLDVSHIPDTSLQAGVEFICPAYDVNALAAAAGTIGYEVFTRLGRRVHRVYV